MAPNPIPDITVRTTTDGAGYPLGVATGTGATAAEALDALRHDATEIAEKQAYDLGSSADGSGVDDSWGLEVVDVRFAHGPTDDHEDGWLAFGTLCTTGVSPLIPPEAPYRG
jgi:hypothetical protein